jgi:hypothetical protein
MADNILDGFSKEGDFARDHGLTVRSVKRYREQGLPWTKWGREIWIGPDEEARAWLLARVHRTPGKAHPNINLKGT